MNVCALLLFVVTVAASSDAFSRIYSDCRNRIMALFSNYSQYRKRLAKFNGMDYRYNTTRSEQEQSEMSKIRDYFQKKELIDVLSNPSVPIEIKLRLIDDSRVNSTGNVFAGGLMRQWDFEDFI